MKIDYSSKFQASVARLGDADVVSAVWATIALIAADHGNLNGLHIEPLHAAPSSFRSCRITGDIRLIFARVGDAAIMLHVDHHDDAYAWARRTRFAINPQTHVPQIYQVEEVAPRSAPVLSSASDNAYPPPGDRPYPFRSWPADSSLLRLGVPEEQISAVRDVADADDLIARKERGLFPDAVWDTLVTLLDEPSALPKLLEDADVETGRLAALGPKASFDELVAASDSAKASIFLSGDDVLNANRSGDLDAWRVFLLPEQRKIAERHFNGPVFVSGGAGTGKTVVALHRVKWLLEHVFTAPSQRILLASFSKTLADALSSLLAQICTPDQLGRVDVCTVDAAASRFLRARNLRTNIDYEAKNALSIMDASRKAVAPDLRFDSTFLLEEFEDVVEANDLRDENAYIRVSRSGRRKTLSRSDRANLWKIFVRFRASISEEGSIRKNEAANRVIRLIRGGTPSPYVAAVVDEAQDLGPVQLRLLAAFTGNATGHAVPDSLLLVGDANQRIYGRPVKLSRCGIDVRGRSKRLKMNYRCTERIRKRAESILRGVAVESLDDEPASRSGLSAVLGELPDETRCQTPEEIPAFIAKTIQAWKSIDGPSRRWGDYAVLATSNSEAQKLAKDLENHWVPAAFVINKTEHIDPEKVQVLTMHRAKGLEFHGVAIVLQADKWPALPSHFASLSQPEKDVVFVQAKSLLYVAMTRAVSHLLLTGSGPAPSQLPPPIS